MIEGRMIISFCFIILPSIVLPNWGADLEDDAVQFGLGVAAAKGESAGEMLPIRPRQYLCTGWCRRSAAGLKASRSNVRKPTCLGRSTGRIAGHLAVAGLRPNRAPPRGKMLCRYSPIQALDGPEGFCRTPPGRQNRFYACTRNACSGMFFHQEICP